MIITYMKAENLKFRRSLFRKLILLIPAGLILMSVIFIFIGIGMGGFSSSVVCNWCMPVACLSVTILCHLANKKEQKHGYRTLYSLPVDLKKTFISKIILTALTLLIISLLLSFITVISECMFSGVRAALGRSGLYAAGYCLLWLSFLWQVPFCLHALWEVCFFPLRLCSGSSLIAGPPGLWLPYLACCPVDYWRKQTHV